MSVMLQKAFSFTAYYFNYLARQTAQYRCESSSRLLRWQLQNHPTFPSKGEPFLFPAILAQAEHRATHATAENKAACARRPGRKAAGTSARTALRLAASRKN